MSPFVAFYSHHYDRWWASWSPLFSFLSSLRTFAKRYQRVFSLASSPQSCFLVYSKCDYSDREEKSKNCGRINQVNARSLESDNPEWHYLHATSWSRSFLVRVFTHTSFFLVLLSSDMFSYRSDNNFFIRLSGFIFATRFMKRPC